MRDAGQEQGKRVAAVPLACAAALHRFRRRHGAVPVLALVPDVAAEIALLEAGADDAVRADAPLALITARLAALRRRHEPPTVLRCGDLAIDLVTHSATRAGRALALLPREYALLLHFARRPGVTITRAQLRAAVWGLDFDPGTNVIAVHVSRLRAKLDRGFAAPMLRTEKGAGYRLVVDPAIEAIDLAG